MFKLTIEDQQGGIADEYSFTEGEFIIGRSHSADVILPSDNVSRRHARIYTVEGRCYIEDLGSANGVFINGRRIHEVFQLQRSAQVKIGDFYVHIEGTDPGTGGEQVFCTLHGQNLGASDQVFHLQRNVSLVGRGKDCSVTIIDPSVSRVHAKITAERSGGLTLEDLKSSNGTFINDERIDVAPIHHGDTVRFGNVSLVVDLPQEDDDAEVGAPSRRGLWITMAVVTTLLLAGILLVIFGGNLFGGDGDAASAEAQAAKAAEEARQQSIALLVDDGKALVSERAWDKALSVWKQVADQDPLHAEARKAINQIGIWKRHEGWIAEAAEHAANKRFGEAVNQLKDIDDASPYFADAQDELLRLAKLKPSLIAQAEAAISAKDCTTAIGLFRQAAQLDPKDATLPERIKKTEKLQKKRRKCRK